MAIHALLVTLSLLEAVVAIVSSAFCCHGICCCRRASTGSVITYQGQTVQYFNQPNTQGQVILIQNPAQATPSVIFPPGQSNPQYGPGYSQVPQLVQQEPPVYSSAPPPDYSREEGKPLQKTQI